MEKELYPAHFIRQTELGPKRQWNAAARLHGGDGEWRGELEEIWQ